MINWHHVGFVVVVTACVALAVFVMRADHQERQTEEDKDV